jgi:hypothetical protein
MRDSTRKMAGQMRQTGGGGEETEEERQEGGKE